MGRPRQNNGAEEDGRRPEEEAFQKALRFIEYRQRSAGETRARIRKWGFDQSTADSVVEHLKLAGVLDDGEFARTFLDELVRKEMGPYRIRRELSKKMIDRELIDATMECYPVADDVERARQAAMRRYSRMSGDTDLKTARASLFGFLVRRGYSRASADEACRLTLQVDTQTGAELE